MTKQTNLPKPLAGKELILAEADKRFRKKVEQIEKHLLTAPSKEKYLELERDIVYKILHKEIDRRNDLLIETIKGGFREEYFNIRRGVSYPLEFINEIRRHYELYLTGIINYNRDVLAVTDPDTIDPDHPKNRIEVSLCEAIIEAIKFYKLEEWLAARRDGREAQPEIHSLIKPGRDQENYRIIDSLLLKCREEISNIASFNSKSYAALYLIIFRKYKIFKTEITFTDLQRQLDQYFGQDTTSYKPGKLTDAVEALKSKYRWVDII